MPAEHVFVAGDNRANSTDSRVTTHGFVPVGNIVGRASEIFWSNGAGREGIWWVRWGERYHPLHFDWSN